MANEKNQRPLRKYYTGMILIILGVMFLLNNFGLIPFDIGESFSKLWPLFLIIPGISLFLSNK